MKHIITISGGLTSAYVAKVVLEKEPDAELVFTDTGWEHPDLFRFLDDLEILFRKPITKLRHKKYKNPEELFKADGILGSNRTPTCSKVLKVDVLKDYLKEKYNNDCVVYFGIDYSEQHRAERIKFQYDKRGIETKFPLIEMKDFFIKDKITTWLNSNGIEIPILYKQGYLHNNCSGGCVRASKTYWLHLLKNNMEVYLERERVETEFKEGKYTFMTNVSLKNFREAALKASKTRFKTLDQVTLFDIRDIISEPCSLFEDELPCVCFEV